MTAKEYLGRAQLIDRRLESKLEQLRQLEALATRTTATVSDMPGGGGGGNQQKMEAAIAKMMDLREEIAGEMCELMDVKTGINRSIRDIEQDEYKLLLEYRYLHYFKWSQIAELLGVSEKHVYRMHGRALKAVKVPG